VAAPAGFFENLLIEGLEFRLGKPCNDSLPLADRCIVQGFPIGGGNLAVALAAGFEIVRWPLYHARVGQLLSFSSLITLVTALASLGEMGVPG